MTSKTPHPLISIAAAALVAVLCAVATTAASAQTWTYKSYKKNGMGGQYDKDRFVMGTVTLAESDGKATLQLNAGNMDSCREGKLAATVARSDTTTTIEPEARLAGCEKWRLVIRNDGSGGTREVMRADGWKPTGFDHDLKPAK